jgi:hypothetical protein
MAYTCHLRLEARGLRRKNKKQYDTRDGRCNHCKIKRELHLETDYAPFTPKPMHRIPPEERCSRLVLDWPLHMRLD